MVCMIFQSPVHTIDKKAFTNAINKREKFLSFAGCYLTKSVLKHTSSIIDFPGNKPVSTNIIQHLTCITTINFF